MTLIRTWSILCVALILSIGPEKAFSGDKKHLDTNEKAFLWRVDAGTSTVWLTGTIHVARTSFYPLAPSIERALDQSDSLAVEIDLTDPTLLANSNLMQSMQYEGEDTLQNHLPAALWEKLNTQLPKLYHLPVAPFEKMRIWALMMSMEMIAAQQGGYLSTAGVDLYLLGKAKVAKKTIISLETAQSQLSALSSTSESSQQTDLSMMLDATYLTSFYADLDALSAAWKKGDPDKMYKISLKTMQRYPNMQKQFDTLLGPRNHAFANQIADLLKKNPNKQIMVAVGAMHLAGPDSVQVHLKKLGLQAIAQPRN